MKNKEKQQSYFVNIGSSSLLVIFLILCLVTFAILSLSSAKSDHSFSQRLAKHRQVYYEASAKAEETVGEIDLILAGASGSSDGFDHYLSSVSAALNESQINGISVNCNVEKDDTVISFQIPAGESQSLQVALQVTDYRKAKTYYTIKTWQVVNHGGQESDRPLNLISIP